MRRLRKINQPALQQPVRGEPSTVVPKEPFFFQKNARKQREDAIAQRAVEQAAVDDQYAREVRRFDRRNDLNDQIARNNADVQMRQRMMQGMPQMNEAAYNVADRVVDARRMMSDAAKVPGQIHPGYYVGGASALASAGLLNAYSQLQNEELPSGVFPTMGRATANLFGGGFAGPSVDPLAAARNNVADANAELGSDRLLEAIVLDQIEGAAEQGVVDEDFAFEAAVDRKAKELMSMPKIFSDGSQGFMAPDAAYSQARQIIELDQKY